MYRLVSGGEAECSFDGDNGNGVNGLVLWARNKCPRKLLWIRRFSLSCSIDYGS